MRCYLVKTTTGPEFKRFGATNADAKLKRDELVAKAEVKKKDVEIEEVDISMVKAELLQFINELCTELDPKGDATP